MPAIGIGPSVRRVADLTMRIIRQFARDRRTIALLFLAPILILTILNFVLNNSTNQVTLGIVAPDGSTGQVVTQELRAAIHGQQGLALTTVARDAVDATLRSGNVDGILIFPTDLSGVAATGTLPLTLDLEGSNPGAAKQLINIAHLLARTLSPTAGAAPTAIATSISTNYLYGGPQFTQTDALAPMLVGVFSFFFVFLLTSVAFLRERSQGTIERLMVSPLRRSELVLGYVCGFTIFALLQSIEVLAFVIGVLQVHYHGNIALLFLVTLALTIGGVNLGIFASAFARNELQVVQFIPLLLVPQILLGGLFFAVKSLPIVLHQLAYIMPLTYANFALQDIMLKGFGLAQIWPDLLFLVGFALVMIALSAYSLRSERI